MLWLTDADRNTVAVVTASQKGVTAWSTMTDEARCDSYENAAVIVSGIDAEDLGNPTPCRRYDVARLVDHIVEAGHRAAPLGRGQTPPSGDDSPHVELSDAPGQLRQAAEEAAQAWDDDSRLSSRFTMPWGEEYTGATLVDMYLAELAAHAWDLALATGQITELDPSIAVTALEGRGP